MKGKPVIIFDDIYTTGKIMEQFCDKLSQSEAEVIAGIIETDNSHEDYLGYKGYYDMNNELLW